MTPNTVLDFHDLKNLVWDVPQLSDVVKCYHSKYQSFFAISGKETEYVVCCMCVFGEIVFQWVTILATNQCNSGLR